MGTEVGTDVGNDDGIEVGAVLGEEEGAELGEEDGRLVGAVDGDEEGAEDGAEDGDEDGAEEGAELGEEEACEAACCYGEARHSGGPSHVWSEERRSGQGERSGVEGSLELACATSRATTATTLLPTSMVSRGCHGLSQVQVGPGGALRTCRPPPSPRTFGRAAAGAG